MDDDHGKARHDKLAGLAAFQLYGLCESQLMQQIEMRILDQLCLGMPLKTALNLAAVLRVPGSLTGLNGAKLTLIRHQLNACVEEAYRLGLYGDYLQVT